MAMRHLERPRLVSRQREKIVRIYPPASAGKRQFQAIATCRSAPSYWFWLSCCVTLFGCGTRPMSSFQGEEATRSERKGWFVECSQRPSHLRLPVGIAVHSVARTVTGTAVQMVAYTSADTAYLQLPLYTMSRGRWSIGEKGRAFLLDQECRSYPLLDVTFEGPRSGPGRIRLAPRQAVEVVLHFPPLSSSSQMALLVYDTAQIPFLVPDQTPSVLGPVPSSEASKFPR